MPVTATPAPGQHLGPGKANHLNSAPRHPPPKILVVFFVLVWFLGPHMLFIAETRKETHTHPSPLRGHLLWSPWSLDLGGRH